MNAGLTAQIPGLRNLRKELGLVPVHEFQTLHLVYSVLKNIFSQGVAEVLFTEGSTFRAMQCVVGCSSYLAILQSALRISFDDISISNYRIIFKISYKYR